MIEEKVRLSVNITPTDEILLEAVYLSRVRNQDRTNKSELIREAIYHLYHAEFDNGNAH